MSEIENDDKKEIKKAAEREVRDREQRGSCGLAGIMVRLQVQYTQGRLRSRRPLQGRLWSDVTFQQNSLLSG